MTITIIGTGNVATQLASWLHQRHPSVQLQIIGRDAAKTALLAQTVAAHSTTNVAELAPEARFVIICVSDDAIPAVAQHLAPYVSNAVVVHTSGSVPSSVLAPFFEKYGTFYPLQTFSQSRRADFSQVPFFINATPQYLVADLRDLARLFSDNIYEMSDADRLILHVAAVFVNNFVNHLFQIGSEIVGQHQLPFDVLKPLIRETVEKIATYAPKDAQTGPAKRGDVKIVQKHLRFLAKQAPQYAQLYTLLSQSINPNLDLSSAE